MEADADTENGHFNMQFGGQLEALSGMMPEVRELCRTFLFRCALQDVKG
jgi:hypothetical protein